MVSATPISKMNVMSRAGFEEALSRAGMQVCGGNLTEVPWSTVAEGESVRRIEFWTSMISLASPP